MDTQCHEALPVDTIDNHQGSGLHSAVFKSTIPTGVTNDMMLSSARHPAMEMAIRNLPKFHAITWFWARLQPYCCIMLSAGPLFLSLALTDFLLRLTPTERSLIQVVNQTELAPYISDLESASWHKSDAKVLMWVGYRPWIWMPLGVMGLTVALGVIDWILVKAHQVFFRSQSSLTCDPKSFKVS